MRAASRLEAAACIVAGGSGIVAYKVLGGQSGYAQRDMRSEKTRGVQSLLSGKAKVGHYHINAYGDTAAVQRAILANERRRMDTGISPTQLARGEEMLIPRWDVLKLWNDAMKGPYDTICKFGFVALRKLSTTSQPATSP